MNTLMKNQTEANVREDGFSPDAELRQDSLIQVILRRQWLVLALVLACLAGGLAYLAKAIPVYSSSSRLYVEQAGPRIMTENEGIMTQSKNYLYTQSSLMTSTPIVSAVVERPEIAKLKTFDGIDHKLAFLKKQLAVEVGKKDDIISVSLESPYPAEASQIVNAVVDSYITYQATQKKSTSAEILKILQVEKVKRDLELTNKHQEILDFKMANPDLALEDNSGNIMLQGLGRLMQELTTAKIDTINARANFEAVKSMVNDPGKLQQLIEARRSSVYIAFDQQETRLRNEKDQLVLRSADLRNKVKEDHPSVRAIEEKIGQIDAKLRQIQGDAAGACLEVANQNWLAAQQREQEFQAEVDKQRQQAEELNSKTARYTILNSELKRSENLCDILDSRIRELNVTEDAGVLNISILEVAQPGLEPIKPQRSRIMVMALILGLMLGCGLAPMLDWMDHRLRNLDEIGAVLGVPVLGTVPHMKKEKDLVARGMLAHLEPLSHLTESYKTVRTAIYFGCPDGHNKTILVTSPEPSDGKSTTVSNLAIAMAQSGQRVLLLDCDFRKPVQHTIFGRVQEPGLSTVLTGQALLAEAFQETAVSNLTLISCGPIPVNPSELLNSAAFAALLTELQTRFDRILIDSPPIMAITDARILAALTDVTLLVVRVEKTSRNAAQIARAGLAGVGAKLLGAIVNDISPKGRRYGYGYHPGGYGHGYYGSQSPRQESRA